MVHKFSKRCKEMERKNCSLTIFQCNLYSAKDFYKRGCEHFKIAHYSLVSIQCGYECYHTLKLLHHSWATDISTKRFRAFERGTMSHCGLRDCKVIGSQNLRLYQPGIEPGLFEDWPRQQFFFRPSTLTSNIFTAYWPLWKALNPFIRYLIL